MAKHYYLSNKTLLAEFAKSKDAGQMTDGLAQCFLLLVERMASRGNFRGYSYRDDMEAQALMQLTTTWDKFDPDKTSNCFAYYSQTVWNAFLRVIKAEKRAQQIRDAVLSSQGMKASHSFHLDHEISEREISLEDDKQA